MNKHLIIGLLIIAVGGGAYFMQNTKQNNHTGHTNTQVPQSHRGYEIEVTQKPNADQITLNEPTTIKYKIKNDKGETVKNFSIAHEKIMHFILVRKDIMQFQHLHPVYDKSTGEFSVDIIFTVDGPYRFFADFTPEDENPQKLPVAIHSDINVGDISGFQPHDVVVSTNKDITAGAIDDNYLVRYEMPKELKNQTPTTYGLTIEQNGQPVTLEKYLGALGHSVVLREETLDYIHTHAGEVVGEDGEDHSQMGHDKLTEQSANKIDFSTTFPESGKYKIFTQFQHTGKVITTDYVVNVQ